MSYARCRLWLGVCCVGVLVVLSGLALWFGLPERFLSTEYSGGLSAFLELGSFFLLTSLLLFPFEVLGGLVLPRKFGRTTVSSWEFFKRLLLASSLHVLVYTLLASALLGVSHTISPAAGFLLFLSFLICLLLAQTQLAYLLGGIVSTTPQELSAGNVQETRVDGESYTGGIVGLPGLETVLIPESWRLTLSEIERKGQLNRKALILSSGMRLRGLLGALLFVIAGFAVALFPESSSLLSTAGVVNTALWFTLWSFIGLLILPTFSRSAVLIADKRLAPANPSEFVHTIAKLEALQDAEPTRSAALESVFHPIPSVATRKKALIESSRQAQGLGLWNIARMSIFLSWAGLNLLSRAVHCNCGRPHLWVMLPTD